MPSDAAALLLALHAPSAGAAQKASSLAEQLQSGYLWEAAPEGLSFGSWSPCIDRCPLPDLPLFLPLRRHQVEQSPRWPLVTTRLFSALGPGGDVVLTARLEMGGNLDDEWFAVWILLQLTKEVPGLAASVYDEEDGDICLVQAAEVLPAWLEPDVSANRSWLYNGQLHIIDPRQHRSAITSPSVAVEYLRRFSAQTCANATLQREAFARLAGFPEVALAKSSHHVRLSLPVSAARALSSVPGITPLSVAKWIEEDDDGDETNPIFPGPTVDCLVNFTRRSYAVVSSRADDIASALCAGMSHLLVEAQVEEERAFFKYRAVLHARGFFNTPDAAEVARREMLARAKWRENSSSALSLVHQTLLRAVRDPRQCSPPGAGEFIVGPEDDDGWLDDESEVDRATKDHLAQDADVRLDEFMRGTGEATMGAEGLTPCGPIEFDADTFFDILAGRLHSDSDGDDGLANESTGEGAEKVRNMDESSLLEGEDAEEDAAIRRAALHRLGGEDDDALEAMLFAHAQALGGASPAMALAGAAGLKLPNVPREERS